MMNVTQSLELQNQVRQNAEECRNSFKELCVWEKEIKEKDKELKKNSPYDKDYLKTLPFRGLIPSKTPTTDAMVTEPAKEKDIIMKNAAAIKLSAAEKKKEEGNKYVKLGEYEKALRCYTEAININPKDKFFYTNRALCYLKLERYLEGIEDCDRALNLDKNAVKALYRRMQAYECLGNHLTAFNDCKNVLDIEPNNKDAQRSLDRINERLKKAPAKGPGFTRMSNMVKIEPINKPAHKRSTKPLVNVKVTEIFNSKEKMEIASKALNISDEDIDKVFNSNCGSYVEVKKPATPILQQKEAVAALQKDRDFQSKDKKKQQTIMSSFEDLLDKSISETVEERPIPTSSAQFVAAWREMNEEQKYNYLSKIEVENLIKILGAGFEYETLIGILKIIYKFYLHYKNPQNAAVLYALSQHSQTSILSMFMTSEERETLDNILDAMKTDKTLTTAQLSAVQKAFNIE